MSNETGFGVVETLILLVIVVLIGGASYVVYHDHHKVTTASTTHVATSASSASKESNSTVNPYAGWKTYCDSVYHYCFKYPTDWTVSSTTVANSVGGEGGIELLSPDKTVQISYSNESVKDSDISSFVPNLMTTMTVGSKSYTLVGGYIPSTGDNGLAGNDIPAYQVVNSADVQQYPLVVGQSSEFLSNPSFTDTYPIGTSDVGSLKAFPAVTISNVQESEAWLSSSTAAVSIQILKSLYYE